MGSRYSATLISQVTEAVTEEVRLWIRVKVTMDGVKEVLGMWAAENEGAKFWLPILTELKNRGRIF